MASMNEEYKAGLRHLLQTKGSVVRQGNHYGAYDEWYTVWEDYSTYGWHDYTVDEHLRGRYNRVKRADWRERPSWDQHEHVFVEGSGCSLVIPEGVEAREVSYSEFQDTFSDNRDSVGVNAWGGEKGEPSAIHCACGKYSGLMVRWDGSLMEALQVILGFSPDNSFTF